LHGIRLKLPTEFDKKEEWVSYMHTTEMEEWLDYFNVISEKDSYPVIHSINGIIDVIHNPSGKQVRVHQMAHLL